MPSPYLYFAYAFGEHADDLSAIPVTPAIDGSVSYYYGWTDPYEYNLVTNPAALPIPRGQMNQLFYDITNNLQEYQQYGTPQWVTGNTVSYPIYSRVYYLGVVYESQVASNTVTPGTDATWRVISGNVGGIPIGTTIDFCGPIVPTDFILCDGSGVSRATYASLLSSISQTQNGTITNTLNTVSGLSSTSAMYGANGLIPGMAIEGAGIPAGTTILTIVDGTDITMSQNATASGTISIQFFNWGNGNGSTTFNLPSFTRSTSVGSGGTGTTTIGNVLGQSGGEENHVLSEGEMPSHIHSGSYVTLGLDQKNGSGANGLIQPNVPGYSNVNETLTIAPDGGGAAHNTMQPSKIVTKCIKYQ